MSLIQHFATITELLPDSRCVAITRSGHRIIVKRPEWVPDSGIAPDGRLHYCVGRRIVARTDEISEFEIFMVTYATIPPSFGVAAGQKTISENSDFWRALTPIKESAK